MQAPHDLNTPPRPDERLTGIDQTVNPDVISQMTTSWSSTQFLAQQQLSGNGIALAMLLEALYSTYSSHPTSTTSSLSAQDLWHDLCQVAPVFPKPQHLFPSNSRAGGYREIYNQTSVWGRASIMRGICGVYGHLGKSGADMDIIRFVDQDVTRNRYNYAWVYPCLLPATNRWRSHVSCDSKSLYDEQQKLN